jgi:hypothetical protein
MRRSRCLWLIWLTALLLGGAAILPRTPTVQAAQSCSDEAEIVEQTLDPASGVVAPDATFHIAWTLRNSGDCTWDRTYRLIFISGERMDAPRTTRLRDSVLPGESVTLALDFTAPSAAAVYTGIWQLRSGASVNFGPKLTVSIEVSQDQAAGDVVLPEVLAFGGMGAGDDATALIFCVENGALPSTPTLVVDREELDYRYATLYLCSLAEGSAVTVTATDPEGHVFTRSYIEDAPVTATDDDDNSYTGTVLSVSLVWLVQAPSGSWVISVASDDYHDKATIRVPQPTPLPDGENYPQLDNAPTAPIDPFAAAGGCHYNYTPGQAMTISGQYLPADSTLQIGFYQDRMGYGYLADQVAVHSDAAGSITLPYAALSEPGSYNVVILKNIDPAGYSQNGTEYDFGVTADQVAFTCFTVVLAEAPEFPLRLAFAAGSPGQTEIEVFDFTTGEPYYPITTYGGCDASEPAWWPDGAWVIYQSNCIRDDSAGYIEMSAGTDYDLYASQIDYTYATAEADRLVRLTATPHLDETEPDANGDGLIVYRQSPAGASLDESGELWLLDIFNETNTSLGLIGRAPAWSPDGTRIALMSDVDGSWQIYVYDMKQKQVWLVSANCDSQCRLPAWSPDGKQVIYQQSVSTDDATSVGLWIANADGSSQPRQFLAGEYGRASWSAEGWIAFEGPEGIYRATPGRHPTAQRYLISDPDWQDFGSPAWSH